MAKLQLIDDDGKTILLEADLGVKEGEWNIFDPDEAQHLIMEIQSLIDWDER